MRREIRDRFRTLPFAARWLPEINIEALKGLHEFPEIIEKDNEIVAQSEHTVIVNSGGCEVITK